MLLLLVCVGGKHSTKWLRIDCALLLSFACDGSGEDSDADSNCNSVDEQCDGDGKGRRNNGGGSCMIIKGRGMRKENGNSNCTELTRLWKEMKLTSVILHNAATSSNRSHYVGNPLLT